MDEGPSQWCLLCGRMTYESVTPDRMHAQGYDQGHTEDVCPTCGALDPDDVTDNEETALAIQEREEEHSGKESSGSQGRGEG